MDTTYLESFTLGEPALVCRWRLANATLPLEGRHLRAFAARTVNGRTVSTGLVAWAKQHMEWTLAEGAKEDPDGVLMVVVDTQGRAAMSTGPYVGLDATSANDLAQRALAARTEGLRTGVSPEDLWCVRGDTLVWSAAEGCTPCGSCTLIADLARTIGMTVVRSEDLLPSALTEGFHADEVFLVSDEHGVVPASDRGGSRAERFRQSYLKLFT